MIVDPKKWHPLNNDVQKEKKTMKITLKQSYKLPSVGKWHAIQM